MNVGYQLLQPLALVLQLPQAAQLADTHPAALLFPQVEGGLAHALFSTHLAALGTAFHPIQRIDDLLLAVPFPSILQWLSFPRARHCSFWLRMNSRMWLASTSVKDGVMKSLLFVTSIIAGLALSGCGSIVTSIREPKDVPPAPGSVVDGSTYYLPRGKVLVSGAWNKDARSWDVKISPVIEADPSARYVVSRSQHVLFDDDVTVSVDPNTGLLQTVNATSTDRTVDAISGLISAAASAITFGAGLGPTAAGGASATEKASEFTHLRKNAFFSSFQVVLDEESTNSIPLVASPDPETNRLYAKFTVGAAFLDYDPTKERRSISGDSKPGVLVRRLIPYSIVVTATVYNFDGTASGTFGSPPQTVMLPDTKHDYCLPFDRTPLVSNTTKVGLANGIVQSHQQIRPSIVMGIVGIPKSILGALAPIPLQIRNDQLNLLTAEDKTLSTSQDIKKLKPQ